MGSNEDNNNKWGTLKPVEDLSLKGWRHESGKIFHSTNRSPFRIYQAGSAAALWGSVHSEGSFMVCVHGRV